MPVTLSLRSHPKPQVPKPQIPWARNTKRQTPSVRYSDFGPCGSWAGLLLSAVSISSCWLHCLVLLRVSASLLDSLEL